MRIELSGQFSTFIRDSRFVFSTTEYMLCKYHVYVSLKSENPFFRRIRHSNYWRTEQMINLFINLIACCCFFSILPCSVSLPLHSVSVFSARMKIAGRAHSQMIPMCRTRSFVCHSFDEYAMRCDAGHHGCENYWINLYARTHVDFNGINDA